jgi:protein-tyrosine phosphatase
MIDLHCHLMPGVDDGARTLEQAVSVLQRMADQGIREIALTPHLDATRIGDGPPAAHDEAFAALAARAPASVRLHRGAEVMLDRSVPAGGLGRGVTLGGSRYLLCEFTGMVAGPAAAAALFQLVQAGLIPVVAHPERYRACSLQTVASWRERGALMQLDANALFHPTGRGPRARALLAHGLADILAADNHGDHRSLAEPYRRLSGAGGEAVATLLMVDNPAAILADRATTGVPPFELKLPLLTRIKGWLGELNS